MNINKDDPNSDLRNGLLQSMISKNPEEIQKAAKEFESKADQKQMLPEDKELLSQAKKSAEKLKAAG